MVKMPPVAAVEAASKLPPSKSTLTIGVSAFYYADKLFTPLTTTLVYSISTVLFPQFSEKFTQQDRPAYLRYIWNMLRGTLLLILPMSAVLAAFGTPIVKVLFEGGSFDAASPPRPAAAARPSPRPPA